MSQSYSLCASSFSFCGISFSLSRRTQFAHPFTDVQPQPRGSNAFRLTPQRPPVLTLPLACSSHCLSVFAVKTRFGLPKRTQCAAQLLTEPRPQGSGAFSVAFRIVTDAKRPDNLTPQRSQPPQRPPLLTLPFSSQRLRVSAVNPRLGLPKRTQCAAQLLTEPRPQGSGAFSVAFRIVTDAQSPDNLTPQRSQPPQRPPVLTLLSSSQRLSVSAVNPL
jgi:hypothetical protein